MKNNKAVGVDEVPIELLNYYETEEVGKQIRAIMNNALNSGNVESILKDVRIKVLFKKGDKKDMNNYRGISLISHGGKLLERLIQNRLYEYVEEIGFLPESQNGFRQNRSTIDSLFVSKMLTSNAIAKKTKMYKCFVDLTKAYDKVNRRVLWMVLERIGVPQKMIRLIQNIHDGSKAKVKLENGEETEEFDLEAGLKQGSVFAPLLFNIFFGAIIAWWKEKMQHRGIWYKYRLGYDLLLGITKKVNNRSVNFDQVQELLFADDQEIITMTEEEMQESLDLLDEATRVFGQEISIVKTKVMVIGGEEDEETNIFI